MSRSDRPNHLKHRRAVIDQVRELYPSFRCVYCGMAADTVDHIIPKVRLANPRFHDPANLVPACGCCNRAKGKMDLADFLTRERAAVFVREARFASQAARGTAKRILSQGFSRPMVRRSQARDMEQKGRRRKFLVGQARRRAQP